MLSPRLPRQRGTVLPITLVVLTAMVLAGVSVYRSSYAGHRAIGNLAFHQSATRAADVGIERALAWLQTQRGGTGLYGDTAANGASLGYFASRPRVAEPAGDAAWDAYWERSLQPTGRINTLPADAAGNAVSFVIHRLCDAPGDPDAAASGCVAGPASADREGASRGAGRKAMWSTGQHYYRITVRVEGPRNAVSFVQAVVAI